MWTLDKIGSYIVNTYFYQWWNEVWTTSTRGARKVMLLGKHFDKGSILTGQIIATLPSSHPKWWFSNGPKMPETFRFRNRSHLPRWFRGSNHHGQSEVLKDQLAVYFLDSIGPLCSWSNFLDWLPHKNGIKKKVYQSIASKKLTFWNSTWFRFWLVISKCIEMIVSFYATNSEEVVLYAIANPPQKTSLVGHLCTFQIY